METGLKDKTALVTGSSRGIGKEIAKALLSEGCAVVLTGRDGPALDSTCKELSKEYGKAKISCFQGDMTSSVDVLECAKYVKKTCKRIDVLVLNVGSGRSKPCLEANRNEWERVFSVNLFGAVSAIEEFTPMMKEKGGTITFISSIAGISSTGAPMPYSAAKAALCAYSKDLSIALAKDNIRVNTVAPGNVLFAGGRWEEILKQRPSALDEVKKRVPMARFAKPEEIADAVVFLSSHSSSFITGACLVVDGGETKAYM